MTRLEANQEAYRIVRKFPQIEQAVLAPALVGEIANALLYGPKEKRIQTFAQKWCSKHQMAYRTATCPACI